MKLPNENAEKDAEKDKAEKQPNDKDSPSDDDKQSEGNVFVSFVKRNPYFRMSFVMAIICSIDDLS